jgi:hypothetical protein
VNFIHMNCTNNEVPTVESISVLWCVISCILVCFFEMFESFV